MSPSCDEAHNAGENLGRYGGLTIAVAFMVLVAWGYLYDLGGDDDDEISDVDNASFRGMGHGSREVERKAYNGFVPCGTAAVGWNGTR